MISHYQKRCDEKKTFPRRLLLSFAPVSSEKNIKFLKWLGVEIPAESEKLLKKDYSQVIDQYLDGVIDKSIASVIKEAIINSLPLPTIV